MTGRQLSFNFKRIFRAKIYVNDVLYIPRRFQIMRLVPVFRDLCIAVSEGAEAFDVSGIIIFLYEIQFGPFQISSFVIAHICFQLPALIKRICMISITAGGTGRAARISCALDTVRVLFQDRIIVFSGFSV